MNKTLRASPDTIEDYYDAVRSYKLRPTNVPTVYVDPDGNHIRVPLPDGMSGPQRRETLEQIRERARVAREI